MLAFTFDGFQANRLQIKRDQRIVRPERTRFAGQNLADDLLTRFTGIGCAKRKPLVHRSAERVNVSAVVNLGGPAQNLLRRHVER